MFPRNVPALVGMSQVYLVLVAFATKGDAAPPAK
jgi:hypothetical protein